jgi:hypothetical protein
MPKYYFGKSINRIARTQGSSSNYALTHTNQNTYPNKNGIYNYIKTPKTTTAQPPPPDLHH